MFLTFSVAPTVILMKDGSDLKICIPMLVVNQHAVSQMKQGKQLGTLQASILTRMIYKYIT